MARHARAGMGPSNDRRGPQSRRWPRTPAEIDPPPAERFLGSVTPHLPTRHLPIVHTDFSRFFARFLNAPFSTIPPPSPEFSHSSQTRPTSDTTTYYDPRRLVHLAISRMRKGNSTRARHFSPSPSFPRLRKRERIVGEKRDGTRTDQSAVADSSLFFFLLNSIGHKEVKRRRRRRKGEEEGGKSEKVK